VTSDIGNVFVMIGADPNTEWLNGCLELDARGFVVTGKLRREQTIASPFASSLARVFAVGDIRSGSVKRVASSVGEGSVAVPAVHQYLNPGQP
jgi:thioredoxin reductase (NADPH)